MPIAFLLLFSFLLSYQKFSIPSVVQTQATLPQPSQNQQDALANRAKINEAIVRVISDGGKSGSGFLVAGRQLVLTNYHVVKGGNNFELLYLAYGRVRMTVRATLWRYDATSDLALLKTDEPLLAEPLTVAFYSPEQPADIFALGYPGAVDIAGDTSDDYVRVSWSKGNVTRVLRNSSGYPRIEHSARISQGYSGGPLIDICGNVAGVNTAVAREDAMSGFVVSIAIASDQILLFLRANGVSLASVAKPCQQNTAVATSFDERLEQEKLTAAVMTRFDSCVSRHFVKPDVCKPILSGLSSKESREAKSQAEIIKLAAIFRQQERLSGSALANYQMCMAVNRCGANQCERNLIRTMRGRPTAEQRRAIARYRSEGRYAKCAKCEKEAGEYPFQLYFQMTKENERLRREGLCTGPINVQVKLSSSCQFRFDIDQGGLLTRWNGVYTPETKQALAVLSEASVPGGERLPQVEAQQRMAGGNFTFMRLEAPPCGTGSISLIDPYRYPLFR